MDANGKKATTEGDSDSGSDSDLYEPRDSFAAFLVGSPSSYKNNSNGSSHIRSNQSQHSPSSGSRGEPISLISDSDDGDAPVVVLGDSMMKIVEEEETSSSPKQQVLIDKDGDTVMGSDSKSNKHEAPTQASTAPLDFSVATVTETKSTSDPAVVETEPEPPQEAIDSEPHISKATSNRDDDKRLEASVPSDKKSFTKKAAPGALSSTSKTSTNDAMKATGEPKWSISSSDSDSSSDSEDISKATANRDEASVPSDKKSFTKKAAPGASSSTSKTSTNDAMNDAMKATGEPKRSISSDESDSDESEESYDDVKEVKNGWVDVKAGEFVPVNPGFVVVVNREESGLCDYVDDLRPKAMLSKMCPRKVSKEDMTDTKGTRCSEHAGKPQKNIGVKVDPVTRKAVVDTRVPKVAQLPTDIANLNPQHQTLASLANSGSVQTAPQAESEHEKDISSDDESTGSVYTDDGESPLVSDDSDSSDSSAGRRGAVRKKGVSSSSSSSSDSEVNEYERQRQRNMRANAERMQALNIVNPISKHKKPKSGKPRKSRITGDKPKPMRRSSRRPKPVVNDDDVEFTLGMRSAMNLAYNNSRRPESVINDDVALGTHNSEQADDPFDMDMNMDMDMEVEPESSTHSEKQGAKKGEKEVRDQKSSSKGDESGTEVTRGTDRSENRVHQPRFQHDQVGDLPTEEARAQPDGAVATQLAEDADGAQMLREEEVKQLAEDVKGSQMFPEKEVKHDLSASGGHRRVWKPEWFKTSTYDEKRPVRTVSVNKQVRISVEDLELQTRCGICLASTMDEPFAVKECMHRFCRNCARTAVTQQHQCPICQVKASSHRSLRADTNLTGLLQALEPVVSRRSRHTRALLTQAHQTALRVDKLQKEQEKFRKGPITLKRPRPRGGMKNSQRVRKRRATGNNNVHRSGDDDDSSDSDTSDSDVRQNDNTFNFTLRSSHMDDCYVRVPLRATVEHLRLLVFDLLKIPSTSSYVQDYGPIEFCFMCAFVVRGRIESFPVYAGVTTMRHLRQLCEHSNNVTMTFLARRRRQAGGMAAN